jgi:hypothetical protein
LNYKAAVAAVSRLGPEIEEFTGNAPCGAGTKPARCVRFREHRDS